MLGVTSWALVALWLWEGSHEGLFPEEKEYSLMVIRE